MKTWAEVADELGADKTAMAKWVWAREATTEIDRLRARVKKLEGALNQFANCALDESNCADLSVATRRIRTVARAALEDKS